MRNKKAVVRYNRYLVSYRHKDNTITQDLITKNKLNCIDIDKLESAEINCIYKLN